ncbi:GMC oxidoreductase [Maridesulfovibrio sp.]|uniref:GMC oxidoreductase n=1 Tax=Maridesulfovibrio sp. TaxID=2795000 RepID=UPI0029CA7FB9|nr:GMC oxidoreductase [Maridesulfovibrio sp.]
MSDFSDAYCVIGSGLSGVSAARGLIDAGKKVLMLDVGLELPKKNAERVDVLASKPAWKWKSSEKDILTEGVEASAGGVKEKFLFGSNFASRVLDQFPRELIESKFYMSFARNGLGNIWGGGLLPVHAEDMRDWPITPQELEPYYSKVLRYAPLSGRSDSLEKTYPLYCKPSFHAPSKQASALLSKLERNGRKLEDSGLSFGASRLAARFHGRKEGYECQYCGMCLHGCPYGIAYSGSETLDELEQDGNFTYQKGFLVKRLEPETDGVVIYGTDPKSGQALEPVRVKKAFLAAGVFSTTKIMLESLGIKEKSVRVLNSDQFYTPLFSMRGMPRVTEESLHAMCQIFLILRNKGLSPYTIHFSLYTYNQLYKQALDGILGPTAGLFSPFVKLFLSRLFFSISYLHSSESSYLEARLKNDAQGTMVVNSVAAPEAIDVMNRGRMHLLKLSPYTGLVPVLGYKGQKIPGAGNHSGGSFPMKQNPKGLETDSLGRVPGFSNVHLVDASILSSVPATSITFSIMANALRIADCVGNDER